MIRSCSTSPEVGSRLTFGSLLGDPIAQADGDRIAFDAKFADFRPADDRGDDFQHARLDRADFDLQPWAFFFDLRRVAGVGEQNFRVGRDEQKAVVAGEPGEIGHIDEVRDQQAIDAGFGERLAKFVSTSLKTIHERSSQEAGKSAERIASTPERNWDRVDTCYQFAARFAR